MTVGSEATYEQAVIVLPGIMGSELIDTHTHEVLWGVADPGWYWRAWTSGVSLDTLRVTDEERAGRAHRIQASRLLRNAAFAPVLRGFEPYGRLLASVRGAAAHRDAVLPFPYDWRLSIDYNASRLGEAVDDHLRMWRHHKQGSRHAKAVLVAHSMGGLIAHSFLASLGGDRDVSALITLGTPFRGSVKAAGILSTGKGAPLPLPHRRLRALAKTLPGLYDLLPSYHCIDERESFRCLEAGDIAALGGDRELARESLVRLAKLRSTPPLSVPLHAIVGVKQPTEQSLVLADGTATMHEYIGSEDPTRGLLRTDRRGDGTVFRDAATLSDTSPTYLPQGHGALPRSEEVLTHVDAVLTARALGPALGGHSLGLRVPDVLTAGQLCRISADFVDDPAAVFCRIVDTETGMEISRPRLRLQDGAHSADAPLPRPGIYRVEAKTGGFSAVTQLVMVTEPLGRTEEARAR